MIPPYAIFYFHRPGKNIANPNVSLITTNKNIYIGELIIVKPIGPRA